MLLAAFALPGCSSDIEGDAAGECSDGADNDRDGTFDCDDSDCAAAPDCTGNPPTDGGMGGGASSLDWAQVDAGGVHNCGVTADGGLVCWGNDAQGQSTPPGGTYSETRASFFHACALDRDGALHCWGCKGDKNYGQCDVPDTLSDVARFDAGTFATCAATGSGEVSCWGCSSADHGQCEPPPDSFDHLAAGSLHVCGLVDGIVICWGSDTYGQSTPPGSTYSQLGAGTWHTCGVRDDGTVDCWGCNTPSPDDPADFGQCEAPSGSFEQVAAGVYHSCGLKKDGSVACWGCLGAHDGTAADAGQCDPPDDEFESITVGKFHGCGVRADGTANCWGNDFFGQLSVP